MMFEILELAFAVLIAPVVILGGLLSLAADFLRSWFKLSWLFISLDLLGFAAVTWSHMAPDPSAPWDTLVDVIAHAEIFRIPVPFVALATGLATLSASMVLAKPRHTVSRI